MRGNSRGDAMLVPLKEVTSLVLPARADTMSEPGAYTSTHDP